MLSNWLKLYVSNWKQTKVVSTLNIMGLSLGVVAVLLVTLYWKNEHSYNQWNPYKDRVYELKISRGDYVSSYLSAPFADHLDKLSDVVEAYTFMFGYTDLQSIQIEGKEEFLYGTEELQASVFELFPFEAVYGSAKDYQVHYKDALALDVAEAERLFGEGIDPIGKQVVLDRKTLVVRFVYRLPINSSIAPKAVTSYFTEDMIVENKASNWADANYTLLIKLKEGVDLGVEKQRIIDEMGAYYFENWAKGEALTVAQYKVKYAKEASSLLAFYVLDTVHLNPNSVVLGGGETLGKMLLIMGGAAFMLLLLSILNAVNLALVKSFKRAKEVGVRKALGGSKKAIIGQFLFEALLTTFLAIVIALFLVQVFLPYFNLLIDRSLTFSVIQMLPLAIGLLIIISLFAGLIPAMFIAMFDTLKVLKGNLSRSVSGQYIRNGLLLLQFVIAFFFLTSSVFIQKQVSHLLNQDLGFVGDQVLNIRFKVKDQQERYAIYQQVEKDFKKIKGVQEITIHSLNIGGGQNSSSTNTIGEVSFQSNNMPVGYDFLDVFGIQLQGGRFFDRNFASDSINKVVVNENFATRLGKNPLGEKIKWNGRDFEVIGVVKDVVVEGFSNEVVPYTYFMPNSVDWFGDLSDYVSVKISAEDVQGTLKAIEAFWNKRVDNTYPISYSFANQDFQKSYQSTLHLRVLFMSLMGVSIFIALFGLLAIVSFSIENRLKEIAVRKVLGADAWGLVVGISWRFLSYAVVGFVVSVYPVYYVVNLWLSDFVYRIEVDLMPFLISFWLLLFLTSVLVLWKSWKATQLNIIKYVNYE